MSWFRAKVRLCGRLALFAVVLQLVLSFGHMHPDDLGLALTAGAGKTQVQAHVAHAGVGPAGQDRRSTPDDYCPICASIALAGTWVPAAAPVLAAPEPVGRAWPSFPRARSLPGYARSSFQARAPPIG
jgi:hypothetical protein